jgi:o-succinylbenzoate synthase
VTDPAIRLEGVELVRVDIPFRVDMGTAAGTHRVRSLLFVRVAAEGASGWGECAALSDGTSVDPPIDAVESAAIELGVRRLREATAARDGKLPSAAETAQLFGTRPVDRQLAATFEMAVADLKLRTNDESLARSIGLTPGFEALAVGGLVGIPPERDVSTLRRSADRAVAKGVTRLRMKIAPGWDIEPVQAVREDHPDLVIQVDANGSYRPEDAGHLGRLAEFGVLCVEQPLPPADLTASAELARRMAVPVCLDESLSSVHRVRDALRYGSCAVACLKPARLGGLRAALAAHAACAAAGVPVFIGGFFESGLGRASNLALAGRLSMDAAGLVSDLDDPADYLEVDPCGYPPVIDGWVRVPDEPGVGCSPDQGILNRLQARRRWFPATYT